MRIKGFEITVKGVYQSDAYQMYVDNGNRTKHQRFAKANYMTDPEKRLRQIQDITLGDDGTELAVTLNLGKTVDWEKAGFENQCDFLALRERAMFHNVSSMVSAKRRAEFEVYLINILDDADHIQSKQGNYEAICHLIDSQYTDHTEVFSDTKPDLAFREQYRALLYDFLQLKIDSIVTAEKEDVGESIKVVTKKALKWKGKKSALGTLFGLFYKAGLIEGTKADVARALCAMFENLKESSLNDNMKLKVNTKEGKVYYNKATEDLLKGWIEDIKESTPKTK